MDNSEYFSVSNIYCEDVRTEIGNKHSYMGCIIGVFVSINEDNFVIPRLNIVMTVHGRTDVDMSDISIALHHPQSSKEEANFIEIPKQISDAKNHDRKMRNFLFRTVLTLEELQVKDGDKINTSIRIKDKIIQGNPLMFKKE